VMEDRVSWATLCASSDAIPEEQLWQQDIRRPEQREPLNAKGTGEA
jgi:hypothetical protein